MKIYPDASPKPLEPVRVNGTGRSIVVFLTSSPGDKKNFRCVSCGKLICQYESEIGLIVLSNESPKDKAPIDILCQRCRTMYRFLW